MFHISDGARGGFDYLNSSSLTWGGDPRLGASSNLGSSVKRIQDWPGPIELGANAWALPAERWPLSDQLRF